MVQELPEGTVTVLFTDVEGSTELSATVGDAAARDLLRSCEELARQQIKMHDGFEVKGLGDGLMVAFSSARRAVQCAIEVQRAFEERNLARPDEAVRLRIGLNTGEVIREQADLFGSTVNAAARIESRAESGQILASDSVKAVLGAGSEIEFVDRGQFRLKGFAERWQLYEVPWQREATSRATLAGRTPFVGREQERDQLRGLLEEALRGRGALAMLVGEPGIGKTRLTQEIVTEARSRGFLTLTGHCYEMEGAPPYIPFVEAIEVAERTLDADAFRASLGDDAPQIAKLMPRIHQLFPEIGPAIELPPEQERRYLLNSLRDYIERSAKTQPLLLVLDDLHWADESTMLLLAHIAERLDQMAVVVIGTYRDTDLDATLPLARTLDDLTRRRLLRRIPLNRLTEDVVTAMLRARSGQEPPKAIVEVIYLETEGNPFFVEETFQYLAEEGKLFDEAGQWRTDVEVSEVEVPEGVRLVLGRRIERVSDECQRVLASAAAIGRAFTFALLEELIDIDEDALLDAVDEAERAGLVSSEAIAGEAQIMFAHEQIRQTLLANVSLPRRQRLHLRVADAIERSAGDHAEQHAASIAHHLYQSGAAADLERTVRYLVLAGDQAAAAAAFEDSLRLFGYALELHAEEDQRGRADLLFKRGVARRSTGQWDDGLDDWEQALTIYEQIGDADAAGSLCYQMSKHLSWGARQGEAAEVAFRGLALLGDRVSADRARLLATAAAATAWAPSQVDHAAVETMFSDALEMAAELGGDGLMGSVLLAKTIADFGWARFHEVGEQGRRGIELLRSAGNAYDAVDLQTFVTTSLIFQGRTAEGTELARQTVAEAERLGHTGAVWSAGNQLMAGVGLTGDLAAYEQTCLEHIERGERAGIPFVFMSRVYLTSALFSRGRWEEAREQLEALVDAELASELQVGAVSGFLIRVFAYLGDRDKALAMLQQRSDVLPRRGQPVGGGNIGLLMGAIEALAVLGEREQAAALHDGALASIETGMRMSADGAILIETGAAIAAACGERWDVAEQHFETALRQAHEIPTPISQAEVRRWHAWMLLSRDDPGDREQARERLTEAIEMYREMGMPKHLEIAETLLAEAAD